MPCLNSENTIVEAIESVLAQDYANIELIIIDDGSSDSSFKIVESYQFKDYRIKVYCNNGQHGVSHARNIGIDKSSGKFICFLDSDDYLLPGSITVRVKTIIEQGCKVVHGSYLKLLPSGNFSKKKSPLYISFNEMLRKNYIGNLTGMYDAEVLGKLFQKPIRHEDYLMWCQLLRLVKYSHSTGPEPIAVYRVSSNSLSGNKFKAFIWHWSVLRDGLCLNLPRSLYYQSFYLCASFLERLHQIYTKKLK